MLAVESAWCAVVAWVTWGVLMEPDMILGWYYRVLERLAANGLTWIAKPLGYCGTCFSGQIAFWYYMIEYRGEWQIFEHIGIVCLTIFAFLIIKKWTKKNGLV